MPGKQHATVFSLHGPPGTPMPILPREPDIYPDNLLDDPNLGEQEDARWWALYTVARAEKKLLRLLRDLDVPHYGPLVPQRNRSSSGRTRTSYIPLFTGYVFVYGNDNHRCRALATNCVSRWLDVPDSISLTHDLRQIRSLIEKGVPLLREARLGEGDLVRVRSGPLAGLEGTVIRREGKTRLLVAVNFLQQGASAVLEGWQVDVLR
jgi:transcriptional antiterminator RfaH